jgi:hypothetical protein
MTFCMPAALQRVSFLRGLFSQPVFTKPQYKYRQRDLRHELFLYVYNNAAKQDIV